MQKLYISSKEDSTSSISKKPWIEVKYTNIKQDMAKNKTQRQNKKKV